jgi:hypothetical protein
MQSFLGSCYAGKGGNANAVKTRRNGACKAGDTATDQGSASAVKGKIENEKNGREGGVGIGVGYAGANVVVNATALGTRVGAGADDCGKVAETAADSGAAGPIVDTGVSDGFVGHSPFVLRNNTGNEATARTGVIAPSKTMRI